jgi:hypothetical protein
MAYGARFDAKTQAMRRRKRGMRRRKREPGVCVIHRACASQRLRFRVSRFVCCAHFQLLDFFHAADICDKIHEAPRVDRQVAIRKM